jgi:hypothetical protein
MEENSSLIEEWEFKTIYFILPESLDEKSIERHRVNLDEKLSALGKKGWVLFTQTSVPYTMLERGTLKRTAILSIYTFTKIK